MTIREKQNLGRAVGIQNKNLGAEGGGGGGGREATNTNTISLENAWISKALYKTLFLRMVKNGV